MPEGLRSKGKEMIVGDLMRTHNMEQRNQDDSWSKVIFIFCDFKNMWKIYKREGRGVDAVYFRTCMYEGLIASIREFQGSTLVR